MLSGALGSSADLFAQQVLYNIVKKGKVAYYTVEYASTDVIQDMILFEMEIQEYVDDGSWTFVRVIPPTLSKVVDELPQAPTEKRMELADSLTPLMTSFHDYAKEDRNTVVYLSQLIRNFSLDEIQNLIFFMKGIVRKYGGVHFLVMTEGVHEQSTSLAIKDAVDSVFDFSSEFRGSQLENVVTIQKIRNMIPKARQIRLSIKNTGMVTDTIRRMQ